MAQQLGNVAVGTVVKLNESGVPVNYIVVNQGIPGNSPLYDQSCNGTWVLRQDIKELGVWDSGNSNVLPGADIFTVMANYITQFDPVIQAAIKTVKIPYCVGGGSSTVKSGADGLECKIFPLSGYELGTTTSNTPSFPADGSALSYFQGTSSTDSKRISKYNGSPADYYTRTLSNSNSRYVCFVFYGGYFNSDNASISKGYRPAFVLSPFLSVSDDGTVLAYNVPTLTVPDIIMQGQPVPLSWGAADGANTYILERNADSGGWVQAYSGPNTEFKDTAEFWSTVQYRVKAGDGTNYGEYTESVTIPVVSANALVISGEDKDLGTINRDIHYTVITDTGNEISLIRKVNGQQVTVMTVDSGFSYDIPVIDLPTGSGTIEITASVQQGQEEGEPVTATRTWTYFKSHFAFPKSGGIAQLSQGGQNVFPPTLAEAVRVPPEYGGTLDKTIERLTSYIVPVTGITLTVKAPQGATVTATNRGTTLTETADDGTCQFTLTAFGEWTIKAVLEDKSATTTVTVDTAKPYEVSIGFYDPVLNNNTWEQIAQAVREGKAAELWQPGDTKTITLNGKVGKGLTLDNLQIDVFLLDNKPHNPDIEGNDKLHFQLGKISGKLVGLVDSQYNAYVSETGYFSMNATNTNVGGWDGSQMKANILVGDGTPSSPAADTLLAALPADLRAVMVACTKYTDNVGDPVTSPESVTATQEYLCLADEFEVFGLRGYANPASQNYQKQYQYYKAGNQTIVYKHTNQSDAAVCFMRGPTSGGLFCITTNDGMRGEREAKSDCSIFPIFFVG